MINIETLSIFDENTAFIQLPPRVASAHNHNIIAAVILKPWSFGNNTVWFHYVKWNVLRIEHLHRFDDKLISIENKKDNIDNFVKSDIVIEGNVIVRLYCIVS